MFAAFSSLYSYQDEELNRLWNSIADINHPTLEEYQLFEQYLQNGERPYLNGFRQSLLTLGDLKSGCLTRLNLMQNFMLIGPNQEMPIIETHCINSDPESKKRCIVLFGSYNRVYPDKVRTLLSELQLCGYAGHVLLRIGGFPNMQNGGLKLCHVPYAFKAAALREAQMLGYKEVLWIDSALHPLSALEIIFSIIRIKGYFFISVGSLKDNLPCLLPDAASSLEITPELYDRIPHLSSCLIGLNFENQKVVQFLESWLIETEKVYPNITWFPEELSFSVAAWRLQCTPFSWLGTFVCNENELLQLKKRPLIHFYLDSLR